MVFTILQKCSLGCLLFYKSRNQGVYYYKKVFTRVFHIRKRCSLGRQGVHYQKKRRFPNFLLNTLYVLKINDMLWLLLKVSLLWHSLLCSKVVMMRAMLMPVWSPARYQMGMSRLSSLHAVTCMCVSRLQNLKNHINEGPASKV